MKRYTAYLSVGSNMGDPTANCTRAIASLTATDNITVICQSRFFYTEPVGYVHQDWFVNAMVKIETTLDPAKLLKTLKALERENGRGISGVRFGPRILDMDIIFYEDMVVNEKGLTIPHPRMHKRHFVLRPFCDIDPEVVHPVLKKNVRQLRDALSAENQAVLVQD
ncbi:MAG: 2-amino-4-hydroxy-6-hydroxymethyldihydropteridine diphosphokinase [Thermodesulfobacteriota bacterium]|nr:2-amino-4-hydroxy-6-hydroxymethyldihydropteridine diphosphokinase [Thermodesulfobacteriota bacterium]